MPIVHITHKSTFQKYVCIAKEIQKRPLCSRPQTTQQDPFRTTIYHSEFTHAIVVVLNSITYSIRINIYMYTYVQNTKIYRNGD